MPSQIDELEASIRELQALMATAAPELRPLLASQIEALRSTIQTLVAAAPEMEKARLARPELPPEIAAFFRPETPEPVPAWIPDEATRSSVTEVMMRCPPGARVYSEESSLSCAVPGVPGSLLSSPQGLTLHFNADGRLSSQRYYERGCLRWSIDYHATGGRSMAGRYASEEPKTYVEHGLHTHWSPSGAIVRQSGYIGGKKHGWEKLWEDDGYPIIATKWADGQQVETMTPAQFGS